MTCIPSLKIIFSLCYIPQSLNRRLLQLVFVLPQLDSDCQTTISRHTFCSLNLSSLILPIQESVCTISPDLLSPRLVTQIKLQITHTNSLVDVAFHAYLVQDALQIPKLPDYGINSGGVIGLPLCLSNTQQ